MLGALFLVGQEILCERRVLLWRVPARPDYEYVESRAKARGVVRAIELAARQEAWP